jgi:hypothetical protein
VLDVQAEGDEMRLKSGVHVQACEAGKRFFGMQFSVDGWKYELVHSQSDFSDWCRLETKSPVKGALLHWGGRNYHFQARFSIEERTISVLRTHDDGVLVCIGGLSNLRFIAATVDFDEFPCRFAYSHATLLFQRSGVMRSMKLG